MLSAILAACLCVSGEVYEFSGRSVDARPHWADGCGMERSGTSLRRRSNRTRAASASWVISSSR